MIADVVVGGFAAIAIICVLALILGSVLAAVLGTDDRRFAAIDALARTQRAVRADHHELAEAAVTEAAARDRSLSRADCQRIYEETTEALELAEPVTPRCVDCGRDLKPSETFTCTRCYVANKS